MDLIFPNTSSTDPFKFLIIAIFVFQNAYHIILKNEKLISCQLASQIWLTTTV